MPPVKTEADVEKNIPEEHKEENIFVEPKVVDINSSPNVELTIQPVVKPQKKRTYKKTPNYMSQKKKDQLARARKKASAYKRKQTIARAKQYLDEEKVEFTSATIEPDNNKFNLDYEKISDMMMNKFESRMRAREEAQQRAKQELAEQERFKQQQIKQKREWEMKIREDERKKIKGRFGQFTKQYRGQDKGGLNDLMRPRGNGGTYGNFW